MTDLICGAPVWARINGRNVPGVISYVVPVDPTFWNITVDRPVGRPHGPKMSYMVAPDMVTGRVG